LIKSIKGVANPSRKLVMLAELEPSKEVTGGAWWVNVIRYALCSMCGGAFACRCCCAQPRGCLLGGVGGSVGAVLGWRFGEVVGARAAAASTNAGSVGDGGGLCVGQ
jgi:hypothetical protein